MEERKEERKNILSSRLLYAFAWAAAVITASASGLTAAVALCISQLTDASRMTAEELQKFLKDSYAVLDLL
jgi:mannose/cellobiose epimerase-like protein (N-acyl-D-glucosamine 2-epimerase family)